MSKTSESSLKSALMAEFARTLPHYFAARHEDVRTSGVPDISVTGGRSRRTTWVEAKFANPEFKSKGIQHDTMKRLDACGSALYVVYERQEDGTECTYIFRPRSMTSGHWRGTPGFDHRRVALTIQHIHERLVEP